jgi:hypothetical protein
MSSAAFVPTIPTETTDPINARILAVSEDKIQGFHTDPLGQIAQQSGVALPVVIERIAAMLRAGNDPPRSPDADGDKPGARRAGCLAGAEGKLNDAFDWMFRNDPFSGHVVIRSTDAHTPGSKYRLWTTLKVPSGYSMTKHAELLMQRTGATSFKLMPARRLFALGVGHVRRRGMEPGSKSDDLAEVLDTNVVALNDREWEVLCELKREFAPEELREQIWEPRAEAAGIPIEEFHAIARSLNERKVIGRFSTFLEHVKPLATGERVTRFNALFHWAVPPGREIEAGREVGRFHIMTHAYWREAGAEFNHVNIMGVAHGTERDVVMAHKRAIDQHLGEVASPSATPTSSGAAAARSSRAKSRRWRIASGARRRGPTPRRCGVDPWQPGWICLSSPRRVWMAPGRCSLLSPAASSSSASTPTMRADAACSVRSIVGSRPLSRRVVTG